LAVAAAKGNGVAILDGVYNAIDDEAGLQSQCRQAREYGFDGKTLIHPRQIEIANRGFGPSEEELVWSRAVVAAFADPANADKGAIRIGTEMVERLHLAEAERNLRLAGYVD
jgi:citrate lyase subunit beta/citryl-CoA lyase